jgi:hypothetical protein
LKRKIYLIGQISNDPRSYQWRENIELYLKEQPQDIQNEFEIINPCGNNFSKGVLESSGDEKEFTSNAINDKCGDLLPSQDCGFVMYSNACIANFNHWTPERPLLGTIYELSWYYLTPWKPVVGIHSDPENDFNCRHPFPWKTVHTWVENEIQAIQAFIKLYCR